MSRCAKVKMHREWAFGEVRRYLVCLLCLARWRDASVFVLKPGEPGREAVDRGLELGCGVHELPQPGGQPAEADLFVATPFREFLDAPVGEVHGLAPVLNAVQGRLDHSG